MRSDGSVIIDTKILDDGMQKGFESLKNGMESVGVTAENIGKKIKISFSDMDLSKPIGNAVDKVKSLEQQLSSVTSQFNLAIEYDDDKAAEKLGKKRESIYNQLELARKKLARTIIQETKKEEIAERKSAEKITKAKQREANKQAKAAMKPLRQFGTRLGSLVSGALVFNLISAGLRNMMSYFGKALKSNDAFRQSMARLKGALLTAFQPIYEAVVPALISLMNVLTAVTQKIGQFFASLSGKNYSDLSKNAESLYNEANAIDKVSDSAKKAQKYLAGFDEINKLGKNENISSGVSSTITPDFDSTADTEQYDVATNKLQNILEIIGAIGVALSTWKIAKNFTNSLKESGGIALTVGGAFLYATNWADAFTNGINWGNFTGMLGGLASVVSGLTLAFGKTGGAIGLLVSGIGLIVVSLKDWIKTGQLTTEGLVSLTSGIISLGLAISLLTSNWIPVLITSFAAVVIAVATKGDEIKSKLQELDNWLKVPFTRDWRQTFGPVLGGILNGFFSLCENLWKNVKFTFEGFIDFINGIFSKNWKLSLSGLVDLALGVFSGMNGILGSPFFDLLKKIKELGFAGAIEQIKQQVIQKWQELKGKLSEPFKKLKETVSGLNIGEKIQKIKDTISQKWSSLKSFLSAPFKAIGTAINSLKLGDKFQKIKDTISKKWSNLKSILSSPFDAIVTKISGIAGKIKTAWKSGINSVITILNKFIRWLNDTLSFTIPPITVLGKTIFAGKDITLANIPQIPYLAQGAVIPPNAPFMAMLGDQRHGTNIEAPLSTIQEAVASVMNDNIAAMMVGFEALLEENRLLRQVVEGIEVGDSVIGEAVTRYNRKMSVIKG